VKSPGQMAQERKAWARALFVRALRRHELLRTDATTRALLDALALAEEWGVVGDVVAQETGR
jgi:hypothetical protein